MIHSIQITSGYPTELSCIGNKKFKFNEGLNVIWGLNGTGKSTLLQTIAAYCSIDKRGGWVKSQNWGGSSYSERCKRNAPGKCDAEIAWDGANVFYHSSAVSDQASDSFYLGDGGVTDITLAVSQKMNVYSSGQLRTVKLNKLITEFAKLPAIESCDELAGYIEQCAVGLDKSKRPTLILDEPDCHLDLHTQSLFWQQAMIQVPKSVQVIVTSHSACAAYCDPNAMVEFDSEGLDKSKQAFETIFKKS